MKKLEIKTRNDIYNAPVIDWNNDTYTPIANKTVMDLIEDKISLLGLKVKSEEYKAATSKDGLIKGVVGAYNIVTPNEEFGQRVMFRNSYDKSMSFAFCCGMVTWIN